MALHSNANRVQLSSERIQKLEVNPQSQSRLLSLPPELREQIWIFYYRDHYKAKLFWRADGLYAKSCSSNLRLACRKVDLETERVRENTSINLSFPDSEPTKFKHAVFSIGPLLKKGELFRILNKLSNISVTMRHCERENQKSLTAFNDSLSRLCLRLPKLKRIEILYKHKTGFFEKGTTTTQVNTRGIVYRRDLFCEGLYDDEFTWPASKIWTPSRDLQVYWTTYKEAYDPREFGSSPDTFWGSVRFRVLPRFAGALVVSRDWR